MVHYPFVFLYYWTVRAVAAFAVGIAATGAGQAQTISPPVWTVPEVGALPTRPPRFNAELAQKSKSLACINKTSALTVGRDGLAFLLTVKRIACL